jgi:hypothetical protein
VLCGDEEVGGAGASAAIAATFISVSCSRALATTSSGGWRLFSINLKQIHQSRPKKAMRSPPQGDQHDGPRLGGASLKRPPRDGLIFIVSPMNIVIKETYFIIWRLEGRVKHSQIAPRAHKHQGAVRKVCRCALGIVFPENPAEAYSPTQTIVLTQWRLGGVELSRRFPDFRKGVPVWPLFYQVGSCR